MKTAVLTALMLMVTAVFSWSREVQSHGLLFEQWLRETFFGGYQPQAYTQKWDIPAEANLNYGKIPVNPKAVKYGSPIGLGDAIRQFEIEEPFLLIVGFWQQVNESEKRWVNAQVVRIEPSQWRKLWGNITLADLERLLTVIKDKRLTLEEARKQVQALKAQPPFTTSIIELNPKIDRSQRRLQCSLRFIEFFHQLLPEADRSLQAQPMIFGVSLPQSFDSAPRAQP